MSTQIVLVDDRDPRLTYTSAPQDTSSWSLEGNEREFNQTATWTNRAQASVSMPFNGTMVSVWGTLSGAESGPVLTSYQVDDLPILNVENTSLVDVAQFQVMFYQSPVLKPGIHNLLITNMVNGSLFRLDLLKITPSNDTFDSDIGHLPSSGNTSTIIASSSTSLSSTVSLNKEILSVTESAPISGPSLSFALQPILSATLNPAVSDLPPTSSFTTSIAITSSSSIVSTPATTQSSHSSNRVQIAPILGGVLGGLLFFAIIGAIFLRRRRGETRNKRRRDLFLSREKGRFSFLPSVGSSSEDLQPFGLPKTELRADAARYYGINETFRHDLSPSNDPFASSQDDTLERSAWSPEPIERVARGTGRINGFRQSPPKYNSGSFYHLDPV